MELEDKYDMKYTWVIKNFSTLQTNKISSDQFVSGGCNWRIMAFPKGNNYPNFLSLYLHIAHYKSLPSGWKRHVKFCFTVVNQNKKESLRKGTQHWFKHIEPDWGFTDFISLTELHAKDGGFLVNGDVIVVAEITVLEVIGKLDIKEEVIMEIVETVDVNGFQVPYSQVDFVKGLFQKHPNIASNLCIKNPIMKSGYMNLLCSVIKTLSQPVKEISKDDLAAASAAVVSLTATGFELEWLVEKLEKAKENKKRAIAATTRIQEIDEKLKELEDLEAQLEKEKTDLLASSDCVLVDDVL